MLRIFNKQCFNNLFVGALVAGTTGFTVSSPAHAGVSVSTVANSVYYDENGEAPAGSSMVCEQKATVDNVPGVETNSVDFSWNLKFFQFRDPNGQIFWVPDDSVEGNYARLSVNPYDNSRARVTLPLLDRAHYGYSYHVTAVASVRTPYLMTGQNELKHSPGKIIIAGKNSP